MSVDFSALDLAIVVAYAAGMLAIGAWVSRRIQSFDDFFVAGRGMTAPLLVCTLVSSYYGLDVLFGGSEVSFQEGVVAWFVYLRPYYIAILFAALVIAPRLRRYPFRSLPDVMGHFYGNGARAIAAVASFFYALPFLAIMGIGFLMDAVFGVPYVWGVILGAAISLGYTVLGGLLADALTDTLQFTLMCVTLGIAAILVMDAQGGMAGLEQQLPESFFEPTGTYPVAVLIVFGASALSVLVEPAFYQRIFAAQSYRSVVIALLIGIVLWAAFDWIVTVLGMAAAATGVSDDPRYALLDVTLATLPVGLKGAFVAGVLATAMSTIDSYLLISAGNLAYDIYRPVFRPDLSDERLLPLTRWMTLVAATACVGMALWFQSIVAAWIFVSTLLTSSVLVPVFGGLFTRRPKRLAGLLSSGVGMGVATLFFSAVTFLGIYSEEWGTVIWEIQVGDFALELWQEFALLAALPASILAFLAGQAIGRDGEPRPVADPLAATPAGIAS